VPWPSKQSRGAADPDAEVIVYDDGGSGLLLACQERFASFDCVIECDARHTVWIKRADGTKSVGLAPWQLNRRSLDEVLDGVETRLGLVVRSR